MYNIHGSYIWDIWVCKFRYLNLVGVQRSEFFLCYQRQTCRLARRMCKFFVRIHNEKVKNIHETAAA